MVQFIYHIKIELYEASLWFKFNMFLSFMTYFLNLSTYYIKFEHWIESYTLYISILWKEYDSSKWLIFKFNTECGYGYMSGVWCFEFCVFPFSFSFFFFWHAFKETNGYCSWTVAALFDFSTLFQHISGSRPVNSAQDVQISLFSYFFIKNESHSTIHIFKNYFVTVFISFQLYPNGP